MQVTSVIEKRDKQCTCNLPLGAAIKKLL